MTALDFADSLLCDSWLAYGPAHGSELSTFRDCYSICDSSGGCIYASGLPFAFICLLLSNKFN